MPIYKVKVKWGKESFDQVELNTDEEPLVFKAQLFALTGVSVERQKVMFKGKQLGSDWSGFNFKDGITLLMMGTADAIPTGPTEKVVFMEDLSDNRLAELLDLPAGLENLGNTCYLNATVQCLKTVPELRKALQKFNGNDVALTSPINHSQLLTAAIRELYTSMDKSGQSIAPQMLVSLLHMAIPRFAEKGEGGVFMQQDANECWSELMSMFKRGLKPLTEDRAVDDSVGEDSGLPKYSSFIDQFFGGTYDVTLKCIESDEEPPSHLKESFLQVSCFINADVKYLQSGLKARLNETLTKFSPTLNRDAQYLKTSKISRLPAYMSIQMVRFFYKERESINAKILKDIKFSLVLDVFELCTEELQKKLMPMRAKFKEHEDMKLEEVAKLDDPKEKDKKESTYKYPYHFGDDLGSNNSGFYELQAVLTHKGRSSSSGHYVGWIRRNKDEWFKCDDDDVTSVTNEDILKLSGGGDWHCAYVLLYGPRVLEVESKPE